MAIEKNFLTETPEGIKNKITGCLEGHVFNTETHWEGEGGKEGTCNLVALIKTEILRCDPPIKIEKISIKGGNSYAMIGPNGSGKSTILDAIMQRNNADFQGGGYGYGSGIHEKNQLRIARLDQEELLGDIQDLNVKEVLEQAIEHFKKDFPVNWEEYDEEAHDRNIRNQDAQQRLEELMSEITKLFEIGYFMDRKVKELSGGEKTKLSLLMILSSEPDVLLLDEPTNHLDLESIAKLSGLFDNYKKAGVGIVNVSHVEWFLDMVGQNGTIELEANNRERNVSFSNSPHSKYKKRKENESIIKEISWNNEYLTSYLGEPIFLPGQGLNIANSPLKNITVPTIIGGSLVVFSGKNGSGKSKLMEAMVNKKNLFPRSKGLQIAYLPQFWPEKIAKGKVKDFFNWVKESVNPHSNKQVGRFIRELNKLEFKTKKRNMEEENLSSFSGGEQRLLWFVATSIIEGTDALMLDEPSNHMDSRTMKIIVEAIRNFPGAVVLSSHDLRLMEELEKDPGKSREGRGVNNIVFERKKDGNSIITISQENPSEYAGKIIGQAKKQAKRVKV